MTEQKERLFQSLISDALEAIDDVNGDCAELVDDEYLTDCIHALDDINKNFCILSFHHEAVTPERLYKLAKHNIATTLQIIGLIQDEYEDDIFDEETALFAPTHSH